MLRYIFLLVLIVGCAAPTARRSTASVSRQVDEMFVSTFGDSTKQSIIFIHGGPGFNAKDFEVTTAEKLANLGFYVVTYDQRGQGRSDPTDNKTYNYKKYSDDLRSIISNLRLSKPILIGHSHGGPIAIKFDEHYPKLAKAVVLVGAPVSFWNSMESLKANCSARYNSPDLEKYAKEIEEYFEILSKQQKGSKELIEPTNKFFLHGLFGCKLYQTANPSREESELKQIMKENPAPTEENSMPGFLINESYIYLDHFPQVRKSPGRYFGIYGDEDGLFTRVVLSKIEEAVGRQRFHLVKASSHSVYIDQQAEFLRIVNGIATALRER